MEYQWVVSRRGFIHQTTAALLAASPVALFGAEGDAAGKTKAVIIGSTGKGDYGHGLDVVFNNRPDIQVVAVADPDPTGRNTAAGRSKAARQYADYREMLEKELPRLVVVATRWTDEHHAMGLAALRLGAHVLMEKPFTQTLQEADELLSKAAENKLQIAVAHQMRMAPSIVHLKQFIDSGGIGELLEIRAHGKQDARAGGEDMLVLGTHLFDLMRYFAGDPLWVTSRIYVNGREAGLADRRKATEGIGNILGNDIEAQFAFPKAVTGTFSSRAKSRETAGHWGMYLTGSKGVVRILADVVPRVYQLKSGEVSTLWKADEWRRLEGDPTIEWSAEERGFGPANARLVEDWLAAIRDNREPVCSGRNGMKAVEMAAGVFEAGLSKGRVTFPLTNRGHPLASEV